MKVYCEYNQEYDVFLKEAVQYTLDKYEDELDLSNLEEIKLVDMSTISTDGRAYCDGKKIVVNSRFYEMLPLLNISELEEDENFRIIINTLFHEMRHITDWLYMPVLYRAKSERPTSKEGVTSLFWLEYLAEGKCAIKGTVCWDDFCDDFARRKWRAYKSDPKRENEDNFTYLCKVIPYFMARTQSSEAREHYLSIMTNPLLKEFIIELDQELSRLESEKPFDDTQKLDGLYEIINKYFGEFKTQYEPQPVPWFFQSR